MDIEQKQTEFIDQFVKQASSLKGSALASVVTEATSHPSLFAFSEVLAVPNVIEVRKYGLLSPPPPPHLFTARFILCELLLGFLLFYVILACLIGEECLQVH